jgi:hypothetical protein
MNKMIKNEGMPVRELFYSLKGKPLRKKLVVRICGPYLIDKKAVNFRFDEGTAGCTIKFDGLNEDNIEVFGIDKLHALSLSVDIDSYLKSMTTKYDFYWITGEPYFEE